MPGETQQRDVLFRLGVTSHPGTKAAIAELKSQIDALRATAKEARDALDQATTGGSRGRRKAQGDAFDRGVREAERRARRQYEREERIEREANIREEQRARERARREQEKAEREAQRNRQRTAREAERTRREQEKAERRAEQERLRIARQTQRARAAEEQAQLNDARRLYAERDALNARYSLSMQHAIRHGLMASQGVAHLVRSFTLMAAGGSKASAELVQSLMRAQAAFDLFVGTAMTVHRVSAALTVLRRTTAEMAHARQAGGLAAAYAARLPLARAATLTAGGVTIQEAERGGAVRDWGGHIVGGGVGGMAARAGGRFLTGGAGAIGAAALAALAGAGLAAKSISEARSGYAPNPPQLPGEPYRLPVIGRSIAELEAAAVEKPLEALEWATGRMSESTRKYIFTQIGRPDILERQHRKRQTERTGYHLALSWESRELRERLAEEEGPQLEEELRQRRQRIAERSKVRRATEPLDQRRTMQLRELEAVQAMGRIAGTATFSLAAEPARKGTLAGMSRAARGLREGQATEALELRQGEIATTYDRLNEELLKAQSTMEAMVRDEQKFTEADREKHMAHIVELQQQQLDLIHEGAEVEKQIAETKLAAVRQSIDGIHEELRARQEAIEQQKQSLMTAEEKFGLMTPGEQIRMLQLHRKARAAGEAALSEEDRAALHQIETARRFGEEVTPQMHTREMAIRQKMAGAAAASMTRVEREQYAQLGTEESTLVRRMGAIRAARRGGWAEIAGTSIEAMRIRQEQDLQRKLTVELTDKRALEVQIKDDLDAILPKILTEVDKKLRDRDAAILQKVQHWIAWSREQQRRNETTSTRDRKAALSNT